MKKTIAIASICLALAAGSVSAGAAEQGARYELKPAGDGYLRLDKQTGAVSHCKEIELEWRCVSIADDRQAYRDEIDLLAAENERLKKQLQSSKLTNADRSRQLKVPSDQELDRVMGVFEKMLERFLKFARKLESAPPEDI